MTRRALQLATTAFAIWALAFVLIYGGLSAGCAFGWPAETLRGGLLGILLAALLAGGLVAWRARRAGPAAALAALGSTLLVFAPVAALPPCG